MSAPFSKPTNLTATIMISPTPGTMEATAHRAEFEQLMSELASGSEEAAWKIAELYTPHILRAVRSSLPSAIRPKLDSQDFAQIVWASVLLKRSYLSHVKSPEQLIGLLASVARHKVVDAYRHYTTYQARDLRRESPLEGHEHSERANAMIQCDGGLLDRNLSPSQMAGVHEKWRHLIEQLSERDQKILKLRMRGETYAGIAQMLGIHSATAKRVLDRIIEQLRT
jgi:RNA polymerase sigma factor (sigma-70 family)